MAGDNETDDTSEETQAEETTSERTFTQAEMNRIASQEKKDGRNATLREVAEKLGIEDLDEAASVLADYRESQDREKSEAQKARETADKEAAEAKQLKAEAAREKHETKVERYLLRAGVPEGEGDEEGKALSRVARMLDVEVGADSDEIRDAVEELQKDFPALFAKSQESDDEDDKSKNVDSDTGKGPKKKEASTSVDNARSRLAKRHPQIAKSN
jgi:hypothetical protein